MHEKKMTLHVILMNLSRISSGGFNKVVVFTNVSYVFRSWNCAWNQELR